MTGYCQYRYDASELYKRTKPGMGVETLCGAPTYPAQDVPEMIVVQDENGVLSHKATGRYVVRETRDPHCPRHGGSPEPPPPPVTEAQLQIAASQYQQLHDRYQSQAGISNTEYRPPEYSAPQYVPPQAGVTNAE
jgi:hypothetical protein